MTSIKNLLYELLNEQETPVPEVMEAVAQVRILPGHHAGRDECCHRGLSSSRPIASTLGRDVNVTVLTTDEWEHGASGFITHLKSEPLVDLDLSR